MRRRVVIALIAGAFGGPLTLLAQQTRVYRVGFLGNSTASLEANLVAPFRQELKDLGYVEGRNLVIEYRWAEGDYDRFPKLIGELLGRNVDVIVTAGTPAALAVQSATSTTPLVMVAVGDPVATHLVASLGRPGGNSTGLASIAPDLEGKRLELLREVVPKLSSVTILMNPANAFHLGAEKEARLSAQALGVKVHSVGVQAVPELNRALEAIARERQDALIVLADRVFLHSRADIVAFTARNRLPAVYAYRELVDAGGLMSFGPNYADMHRRAADYVDKILKGAKPGDLPIELPAKFELIVNTKAAKALGLTIPQSVLLRADEVIQ